MTLLNDDESNLMDNLMMTWYDMIKANSHILDRCCWKHELWSNLEGTRMYQVLPVFPLNSEIFISVFNKVTYWLSTVKNPILKKKIYSNAGRMITGTSFLSMSYRILVLIFRVTSKQPKSWPSTNFSFVICKWLFLSVFFRTFERVCVQRISKILQ